MHIPDHAISSEVALATGLLSLAAIPIAVKVTIAGKAAGTGHSPLRFAALTSLIFALQMLNFPVQHGTSGHFLGGALAVASLGFGGGLLSMGLVLLVQAVLFGDGGLTALGANFLNMALIGGLFGLPARNAGRGAREAVVAFAALFCSVLFAAVACAAQLALSGADASGQIFSAMIFAHLPVAAVEAVASLALILWLGKSSSAVSSSPVALFHDRALAIVALVCVAVLAPWASPFPDGLEASMERVGHEVHGAPLFAGFLPDYAIPSLGEGALSVALAGIAGIVVLMLLAGIVNHLVRTSARH